MKGGMSSRTEVVGRTLTLYLPEALVAETRGETVDALMKALAGGGLDRVRLNASALVTLDAAGIGALVRAARITREYTGDRPVLTHGSDAIIRALTVTAVLPLLFESD